MFQTTTPPFVIFWLNPPTPYLDDVIYEWDFLHILGLAVLKIIKDSSLKQFRSHPESISIYLAPGNKEAEDKMCKLNKLTNNYQC